MRGIVRVADRKSIWKTSGRVDITKEHVGQRVSAFLSGQPSVYDSLNLVDPRHQYRSSSMNDSDGIWIGISNRIDQGISVIPKAQIVSVDSFTGVSIAKDDSDVRSGGNRCGMLVIPNIQGRNDSSGGRSAILNSLDGSNQVW